MLGRLARYLRFFGHDTRYARDLPDEEIALAARREGRILLTRDRELAHRVPGALLIRSPAVGEQVREVYGAFPQLDYRLRFDRCPECNGGLRAWVPPPGEWPGDLPRERVEAGLAVEQCSGCGRRYWEGSHTARIRAQVSEWLSTGAG
jgi:uncharacterized protein